MPHHPVTPLRRVALSETTGRPSIGLALGGGIARGWAHIGVVRALVEAGITPSVVAGTSIGALVGGCYLAGKLDSLEEWARSLTRRSVLGYLDIRLRGGGLLAGERLAKRMEEDLDGVLIEHLPKPFVAVCAELATGHEAWLRSGALGKALRASYALPGAFAPINVDGRWLVDGALVNPVPVSVCRAMGARLVIAVGLNGTSFGAAMAEPDLDLESELGETRQNLNKAVPRSFLMAQLFGSSPKSPSLTNVMLGALNLVMDRLGRSRLAGDPPDVYVLPPIGHVGLLDFTRAEELIALGKAAMEAEMPVVRHAMNVLATHPPRPEADSKSA